VAVVTAIASLLSAEVSGIIAGIGMAVIMIWSLFLNYKMLKEGMKMTKIRSAVMVVLPLIAMLAIVAITIYAVASTLGIAA
jgi:amino acid transporter